MRALSWLSYNAEVGPALRRQGGAGSGELLEVVVQCGLSADEELQNTALLILARWADVITFHAELLLGRALTPIILALQYPSELTQYPHLYGVRALASLSMHRHFRRRILNEGAAQPLIELVRSPWTAVRQMRVVPCAIFRKRQMGPSSCCALVAWPPL